MSSIISKAGDDRERANVIYVRFARRPRALDVREMTRQCAAAPPPPARWRLAFARAALINSAAAAAAELSWDCVEGDNKRRRDAAAPSLPSTVVV